MRLDAHQHFWRYDAIQYPWIPRGSPLQRDWLPADLGLLQGPLKLEGSIAVQARQSLAESEWLLELADADPRIRGVVGWVDLRDPRVGIDLDRLSRHPRFVGVRHVVQDEPDDDFMLGADFVRGLRSLRPLGLTYDFLIYPRQLPAAREVARQLPEQRFVVDHLAKPPIREGRLQPWARDLRALAKSPNVWCKISGLVTEADHAAWRPEDFRACLEVAADVFGPYRLMFGSDWPVCLLAASYDRVVEGFMEFARAFDPETREGLWGGNAARFYLERGAS